MLVCLTVRSLSGSKEHITALEDSNGLRCARHVCALSDCLHSRLHQCLGIAATNFIFCEKMNDILRREKPHDDMVSKSMAEHAQRLDRQHLEASPLPSHQHLPTLALTCSTRQSNGDLTSHTPNRSQVPLPIQRLARRVDHIGVRLRIFCKRISRQIMC